MKLLISIAKNIIKNNIIINQDVFLYFFKCHIQLS